LNLSSISATARGKFGQQKTAPFKTVPFFAYFVATQAFSAVFCVIWFLFLINIKP